MKRSLAFHLMLLLAAQGCLVQKKPELSAIASAKRFVKVSPPSVSDIKVKTPFLGFVEPRQLVSAHFLVSGKVESCSVKEGQEVKIGKEICRLDMSAVNLEVTRAHNSVNAAKKALETNLPEKQKALFEAGVIGQTEFEQVRLQSESAKAQYSDATTLHEMALKKQKEHILLAPWNGMITKLLAKPGQPISPELPAAVISDESGWQIAAEVHAAYFAKLKAGTQAWIQSVSTQTIPEPIKLLIVEKATAITPQTQSFRVVLRPEQEKAERSLATGILVGGEIQLSVLKNAMHIPQTSLNSWEQSGKASVYILENGKLKLKDILTGALSDGRVEVLSGLAATDKVVQDIAPDFVGGMSLEAVP